MLIFSAKKFEFEYRVRECGWNETDIRFKVCNANN